MPANLKVALLVLRLSLAAFFAVWVLEKFVKPESTSAIWAHFYFFDQMPAMGPYIIGAVQAAILLAFVLGVLKFWSYGLLMVMHALSTLSTWSQLLHPYDGGNHLFWAGVPALGAFVALFLLRKEDTLFSLGK